jgi:hypothetical protein
MKRTGIIFLTAALGALAGCTETTSSENIKTGGIAALIEVTASNSTTSRIHVDLKVGGDESNTYVILEGGDELVATADGSEKTLQAVDDGEYETTFDTVAGGTEFTVALERTDDDSARNNRGTLPEPFSIDFPKSSDSVSRGEDLTVTWDAASGGTMHIEVDGGCIFFETADAADSQGSYTFPAGTLSPTNDKENESCEVDVVLTRTVSGTTDTALDAESYFHLSQARGTSFTSTP